MTTPKIKSLPRTNYLKIRLSNAERKKLEKAAAQRKMKYSAWSRHVLLDAADKEISNDKSF